MQTLTVFLVLVSGLACLQSIKAEQTPLYNFRISKPFILEETAEINKPGTPEEEVVVKGVKVLSYLGPSYGRDFIVNENAEYVADKNGNRVKSRFKLLLLPISTDRLGITALISTVGSTSG